jgi:hypothetical protein
LDVQTSSIQGWNFPVMTRNPVADIQDDGDSTVINGVGIPDGADIIVSAQVASFLATVKGSDAFNVFTVGDTVKDSNGAIIGAKFLVLN